MMNPLCKHTRVTKQHDGSFQCVTCGAWSLDLSGPYGLDESGHYGQKKPESA